MGWLGLGLAMDMVRAVGFRGLRWALYGGLAYTLGVAVDVQSEPIIWPGVIGSHELFHVLAVVGTFCHFIFIWHYVIPYAVCENAVRCDVAMMARSNSGG
jgi:hemolysin III